jgi:hypothetical protein
MAWLLLLLATAAQAQTIEGSVINAATSKGISEVQVQIRGPLGANPEAAKQYVATTDDQGHFAIAAVSPGQYAFGYLHPGYSPSARVFPEIIQVTKAKSIHLEGRLLPNPRLAGRVVDGRGDPVAKVKLEVLPGIRNGAADASGAFDVSLAPGPHILSAIPPPDLKPPDPDPVTGHPRAWVRTFYPGVASLDAASKLILSAGTEQTGIEIKLLAAPTHALRGVLLTPGGTPVPKVEVTLSEDAHEPPSYRAESDADGAFEFSKVVDGEWRLAAQLTEDAVKLHATQWIAMTGHDLEHLKVTLNAPFTLRGQVVISAPPGTPAPDPIQLLFTPHTPDPRKTTSILNWMLMPDINFDAPAPRDAAAVQAVKMTRQLILEQFGSVVASPDKDGSFRIENLYPGAYRIAALMPPTPPYYLAAIRMGGADIPFPQTEIAYDAVPITVVFKADSGTLHGNAEECAGGPVMLIPQDSNLQSIGFLGSTTCTSADRYEFTAVRPGDYYVLAFIGKSLFNATTPLDEVLLNQANKVTIHSSETATLDLRALTRPGN